MADEIELRNGLDGHLAAMPLNPVVAWENLLEDYWLPADPLYTGSAFYEQVIIPAEDRSNGISIGSAEILQGIYQIMINTEKSKGRASYQSELSKIKAHFVRNKSIDSGSTVITPTKIWSAPPLSDEKYYRVPVSIRYTAT